MGAPGTWRPVELRRNRIMASKKKKKKKKKQAGGALKSSYAKGKPVEKSGRKEASPAKKPEAEKKKTAGGKGEAQEKTGERVQWNVVRRGTLEMKVFQVLLALLAVAALAQYPLWIEVTTSQYRELKEEYPKELEEWEKKYPAEEERKEHEDEKPREPKKPTFGDFLMYQAFILLVQGALFAFIGLNISRRTDMGTPVLDKWLSGDFEPTDAGRLVAHGVPWGIGALLPLLISAGIGRVLGFAAVSQIQETSTWKNALNFINLAVNNQILFVFLLVSALVWTFSRFREKVKLEPHWAGIAAASMLAFSYFYLISRSAGERLSVGLIGSAFLAVSLVGILGFVYWKKGLVYSLLAGMISLGLYPFLANLILG